MGNRVGGRYKREEICVRCCCSVAKSCLILCNLMDSSMPSSSVLYYPPEFAQIHVHWVNDAIKPSHPPAFNLPHHQGLFQWVSSSHQMAKVLEFQLQHVLTMNIQSWFLLGLTGLISFQSKGLSSVFSSTVILKHQFFSTEPFLWSIFHIHTWLLEKP